MLNLAILLDDSAREVPERTAIVCEGTRLSYAQLQAAANQVANAILMKFGLSQIPATAIIQSATLNANLVAVDAFPSEPTYTVTLNKIINHNPDLTTATGNTYDGANAWTANAACWSIVVLIPSAL